MESGSGYWRPFTGTLEEWNATQEDRFKIGTPTIVHEGAELRCPRVAIDETRKIVAIEIGGHSPVCIVLIRPAKKWRENGPVLKPAEPTRLGESKPKA
jgi:hypothetical protein